METATEKKAFNIFIVDDDQAYLTALGFLLMKGSKESGVRIFCYATAEECLRNMNIHPSAIILDYHLDTTNPAAMSGLQMLRKIKEINPALPVIILSAQSNMDVAIDIYEAGAHAYIVKDKRALAEVEKVINELLQTHHKPELRL